MFQNLKTKKHYPADYHNMPDGPYDGIGNFHSNPTSSTDATPTRAPIKSNEGDRLVRCSICGFPCDTERDVKAKLNTWAGLGVSLSDQQTATASPLSDGVTVDAGAQAQNADTYYNRTIVAGCPACGSLRYHIPLTEE